ncbi:MAG: VWA domain-containing protein [Acidobacteriota bacterium]
MLRNLTVALALAFSAALPLHSGFAQQDERPQFRVESEVVDVPVVVIGEEGRLYTDLKQENFTVLEEGEPREITTFVGEESPLTLVILLEYSEVVRYIRGEVIRPAGIFVSQIMQPRDYAAIVAFDMKAEVLSDFTSDRFQLIQAVNTLIRSTPGFRESNLFDSLRFVLVGGTEDNIEYKGLAEVEGRTGVLLVATGLNTFSSISFEDAREVVTRAGVPIYSVGIGELAFIRAESYLSGLERLTFIQAQNNLKTFSEASGGRFYSVRFQGALNSVLDSIATMLRHQYTLGFRPGQKSNEDEDGERVEIEVLVDVDTDGQSDNDRLEVQHRQYYVR